jgi:DNA-binding HxlR family transcriptional regulator
MNKRKYFTKCPISQVATLLSDPWTMLIIRDLLKKEMRFSDLERSLIGISSRTLTSKMKNLENEDIIFKKEFYYSLTKKGAKLDKILDAMFIYGKSFN